MPERDTLVLVPTEWEMRHVRAAGALEAAVCRFELCGLGPVAAAARTAHLLGRSETDLVILVGSAGTYDEERASVGQAIVGSRVSLDGVGAGEGEQFTGVEAMGLAQWPGTADSPEIGSSLALAGGDADDALLLTVCAASASHPEARRRRERYPAVLAEEMEGFGVALACAFAGIPVSVVRGISNVAGERDREKWQMETALKAAMDRVRGLLQA